MTLLATQATELMWEFDAQCVANTAWAYASLKVNEKSLMDAAGEYAVTRTDKFAAQGLANTVWAFATLGIRNEPLLDAIVMAAVDKDFTSQGLANTAWAFATLVERNEMLFDFVATSARKHLKHMPFRELAMTV